MAHAHNSHADLTSRPRLDARLSRLVAAGRITADDADRVRAAADAGDAEPELQRVRLAHARALVDAAVRAGRLSPDDGAAVMSRFEANHDPRPLRTLRGSASGSVAPTVEGTDG
jgi:hypothetical protein